MVYLRKKEDPWNSITSGALTGGILSIRSEYGWLQCSFLNRIDIFRYCSIVNRYWQIFQYCSIVNRYWQIFQYCSIVNRYWQIFQCCSIVNRYWQIFQYCSIVNRYWQIFQCCSIVNRYWQIFQYCSSSNRKWQISPYCSILNGNWLQLLNMAELPCQPFILHERSQQICQFVLYDILTLINTLRCLFRWSSCYYWFSCDRWVLGTDQAQKVILSRCLPLYQPCKEGRESKTVTE